MVVDIATRAETEAPKVTRYRRMPPTFPVSTKAIAADSARKFARDVFTENMEPIEDANELSALLLDFYEDQIQMEVTNPSDGDKQRACDEAHGHVLKVEGNDITCTTCSARWQGVPY